MQRPQHRRRQLFREAIEHVEIGLVDVGQDLELVLSGEQRTREQHLCQNDADRKQIAARIDFRAHHLLGGHVADLALELPGIGTAVDELAAHDAEITELDLTRAAKQHVARRHVAMHDTERPPVLVMSIVREGEAAQHLVGDVQGDAARKSLAARGNRAQKACQRHAVHELHGHEELAMALAEIDHLDDVRVAERGANPRFVAEHGHEARVACELGQDALDGEALGEPAWAGAMRDIDLCHAPEPKPVAKQIGPEHRASDNRGVGHQN